MATFDDLRFTLTGRVTHAWDFAFRTNYGNFANRARTEFAGASLPAKLDDLKIDDDGDVVFETDRGIFFATPVGVVAGGWLTSLGDLRAAMHSVAHIVDTLTTLKGAFPAEGYNVRLGFRFTPVSGLESIRESGFDKILGVVLSSGTQPGFDSLQYSAKFKRGEFTDSVEIEGTDREIHLRYFRDYRGALYDSFGDFLDAADLTGICEQLRPFGDRLASEQRQSVFKRAAAQRDRKL